MSLGHLGLKVVKLVSLDISTGALSWVCWVVASDITNFKVHPGIPGCVWTSDISDVKAAGQSGSCVRYI